MFEPDGLLFYRNVLEPRLRCLPAFCPLLGFRVHTIVLEPGLCPRRHMKHQAVQTVVLPIPEGKPRLSDPVDDLCVLPHHNQVRVEGQLFLVSCTPLLEKPYRGKVIGVVQPTVDPVGRLEHSL